ncbi:IS701 family transposase [Streptomyces sioyaensis]|uniref:IS701 family transposase n=1 Tax=Streptomyces sioyaensis TaxID=67364 RepID=UPI0037A47D75
MHHIHRSADFLAQLSSEVFASLSRCDQRRTAEQFLRGMAVTPSRKTARNVALCLGDPSAEQRFQHFIAHSRWDWEPVRAALAGVVERYAPQLAYVAHPLVLRKAGKDSAGVHRRFVPELGQTVNGQFAYGLWHATATMATPVDWHLELPGPERESPAAAFTSLASQHSGSPRPVVIDARHTSLPALLDGFSLARVPLLARISGAATVTAVEQSRRGTTSSPVSVHELLAWTRRLRRPVNPSVPQRTAATVQVRVPGTAMPRPASGPDGEPRPLTLIGEWDEARAGLSRCWLTDLPGSAPALLRLAALLGEVTGQLAEVDGSGLRDYGGRSFSGWHRHMTMVSVTHAVRVLTGHDRPLLAPAEQQPLPLAM